MPDRRWFLLSAAASLAAPPARADIACYAPVSPYARPCEVGIPIRQVVPAQECQNWCWAACIETIFLLSVFAEILVTTSGGPGYASTNITYLIYHQALLDYDVGGASAGGVIAVILANIVAIFLVRIVGKNLER